MAKVSKIERNKKRIEAVARTRMKRAELRKIIKNPNTGFDEKEIAKKKLTSLPRMTMENRVVNRCEVTGRPRGYLRKFKMSRIAFRELSNSGMVPGVTKSSW
ncbi:MAG: 30S ribosomal protein S14 [Bdellovibrionales bacterium]